MFDLLRDFSLEATITPPADPATSYVAVSLFGNCVGVLSRRQPPDARAGQLDAWKGSLDDYEDAFFHPSTDARPPATLAELALEPGKETRLRLALVDKGSRLLVSVDGAKPFEFALSEPRRDRTLEIRSWHALAIDDLVIEGALKK